MQHNSQLKRMKQFDFKLVRSQKLLFRILLFILSFGIINPSSQAKNSYSSTELGYQFNNSDLRNSSILSVGDFNQTRSFPIVNNNDNKNESDDEESKHSIFTISNTNRIADCSVEKTQFIHFNNEIINTIIPPLFLLHCSWKSYIIA